MRRSWAAIAALLLAGCTGPSGMPAAGFINSDVGDAYLPLEGPEYLVLRGDGAAVVLGGGVAVTSAHTARLVDGKLIIGVSAEYDLMFFHTDKKFSGLRTEAPRVGQQVVSYGQYETGLRKAEGVVTNLDAPVKAQCDACAIQSTFTFDGNAGPGFSGGPVLDAASGRLLGIVFGYVENSGGGRTIYAYDMARVAAELKKIEDKLPADPD
jgi:hypothetical protein